ncbi:hypothetical protein [Novosphingobium album (ex Liu et al. 2023)]|uniref:Uncharacterized protein n=1 Tax=Novosphingobium album (ex Liu et al. 2023) TaxID=3031130 RepID=A0ABT5WXW7_9SPHN|nr:hypothetical protein [Novosphingobium album (ex Liu et al. 2023)]MDE8654762.1 hypothetical protein [Novosphingobium album (ex Liu et al. 2023)]
MPDFSQIPARLIAGVAAGVILLTAILWISHAIGSGARAKVEARLNANQADAAAESGHDAVETLGTQAAAEDAADVITGENADAIHSAPGANAPVAAPVRDAGLRGLCRRAAYQRNPQCLQLAPAR